MLHEMLDCVPIMSSNLPNPQDVTADEVVTFIENMPPEQRKQILTQLGAGDIAGEVNSLLGGGEGDAGGDEGGLGL